MSKEAYDELFYKAFLKEHKNWSLIMHVKYMTGPHKYIFDDEESARNVFEKFSEALKKDRDYSNDRERTFTFSSYNNAMTTVDISDISYITVNPPTDYLFDDENDENEG